MEWYRKVNPVNADRTPNEEQNNGDAIGHT
jgi:hypothetical protein